MKLNVIKDNDGARSSSLRVGRGIGSGIGKTCGRGHKGQKSRSGGKVMPGFEGGQMPLYRRLPIRGFNNYNFRKEFVMINLGQIQKMIDDKRITPTAVLNLETLQKTGFTKKTHHGLKILGTGELKTKISIQAQAISASAQAKVEKTGGNVEIKPLNEKIQKFLPIQVIRRAQAGA